MNTFLISYQKYVVGTVTLYLIGTTFNSLVNRADPDQATLIRVYSVSLENMAYSDPTLVDLTSTFFVLCTSMEVYIIIHSGWSLA